jgi:hypothetical protein
MKIARIVDGNVAEFYSSISIEDVEAYLAQKNLPGDLIEAPDWVVIGTAYDGTGFVEPVPAPEPEPMPLPVPTLTEARAALDVIREQALANYIAKWGEASRREMWGLLATDLRDIAGVPAGNILPAAYPNLVGFLIGSTIKDPAGNPISYPADTEEELTETEQAQRLAIRQQLIFTAANNLRHHQTNHMAFVRRTEEQRARAIEAFDALDDDDKLAWNAATAWADAEVVS